MSKVLQKPRTVSDNIKPGSVSYVLSDLLFSDLSSIHGTNLSSCDAYALFALVSTLLTPGYRGMEHILFSQP